MPGSAAARGRPPAVLLLICIVFPAAARAEGAGARALEQYAIRVVSSAPTPVPDSLLEDLVAGIEALPPGARRFPGGELILQLQDISAPLGLGDGSAARPDWREGRRRFLLYRYEDTPDRRASYRLEGLTPGERERLWRRRAVVHAVIQRWDDRLRWSRRVSWARVTGWRFSGSELLSPSEHAANPYPWAYSRARGMASPSLDLVTFAEEALVPAESLRAGAVPPDDQVRCQEFSKLFFLQQVLLGLDGRAPRDVSSPADRGFECPAFDQWSDLDNLSHIEILLSAPSGQRLQSLFGHLMIHPVYRRGPTRRPAFDPVVEIAAITGLDDDAITLMARGITGGYLNAYNITTAAALRQEQLGRDFRRFRLNLSPPQRMRLMERLWELERRGYYPYRFFSDNCASYVAFALDAVLDPSQALDARGLFVLPTGVLDVMSDRRGGTGAASAADPVPLIERDGDTILSHRSRASAAERAREARIDELALRAPGAAADWRAFQGLARSSDIGSRQAAYGRLRSLARATTTQVPDEDTRRLVLDVLVATVQVERYMAERADDALRRMDGGRITRAPGALFPTAEEIISGRQARFERDSGRDRTGEALDLEVNLLELMDRLPRRPMTPDQLRIASAAARAREVFFGVAALLGDLREEYGVGPPDLDPAGHDPAPAPRAWDRVHSGLGRWAAGAGVRISPAILPAPAAVTATCFICERLGEQRQNGLDPLTEIRLMDGTAYWTLRDQLPSIDHAEVTLARVRTMPREPSVSRESILDALGWGAEASVQLSGDGGAVYQAGGDAEIPLYFTPRYDRHIVLAAGPVVRADGSPWPAALEVGARAELIARLPPAGPLELRAGAWWAPAWRTGGGGWRQRGHAEAALEVLIPRDLEIALVVSGDAVSTRGTFEGGISLALLVGAR